jgi:hypothetical protein
MKVVVLVILLKFIAKIGLLIKLYVLILYHGHATMLLKRSYSTIKYLNYDKD